jgi:hypothetical protein
LEYAYSMQRGYSGLQTKLRNIASQCYNIMVDYKIWDDDYLQAHDNGNMPSLQELSWLEMSHSDRDRYADFRPASLRGGRRRSLFKARSGHK